MEYLTAIRWRSSRSRNARTAMPARPASSGTRCWPTTTRTTLLRLSLVCDRHRLPAPGDAGCRGPAPGPCGQPAPLIRFADGDIPGKQYGRDVKLPERDVDILKRLALEHPEGPLFRNEDGQPWTKNALNCRFQRLKKAKLPFKVNCYAARHSQATDLLENGGSAGAVASLLGHRDPTVVLKFYGKHIDQRPEHLRRLMNGSELPVPAPTAGTGERQGRP